MGRKSRLSNRTQLKTRQTLQTWHVVASISVLAIVSGVGLFFYLNVGNSTDSLANSRQIFTSYEDRLNSWGETSSWHKSQNWMPDLPGEKVNVDEVVVQGHTIRYGDLAIGGNTLLTVREYDTLRVEGSLKLIESARLVIEDHAILVVVGHCLTGGAVKVENRGIAVVLGDLVAEQGAAVFNYNHFYVFGKMKKSGGGQFKGKEKGKKEKKPRKEKNGNQEKKEKKHDQKKKKGEKNQSQKNARQITPQENGASSQPKDFEEENELREDDEETYRYATGDVSALPIELSYFRARATDQGVTLTWATDVEVNNDYFSIERSIDGVEHEVIHEMSGAGNSRSQLTYSYTDERPLPGVSYYRLRQTDFDGQEEAFDWVSVKVDQPSALADDSPLTIDRAYPNPFTDRCTVAFHLDRPGPLEVQLVDMQGTVVVSQPVMGYIGENQFTMDNLTRLQPGTYLMRLVRNGKMSPVARLLKR